MKIKGRKFHVEAVGLRRRVGGDGEHLIRDASRGQIKKAHADAMDASMRHRGPLSKMAAHPATVSVTKVTGNRY